MTKRGVIDSWNILANYKITITWILILSTAHPLKRFQIKRRKYFNTANGKPKNPASQNSKSIQGVHGKKKCYPCLWSNFFQIRSIIWNTIWLTKVPHGIRCLFCRINIISHINEASEYWLIKLLVQITKVTAWIAPLYGLKVELPNLCNNTYRQTSYVFSNDKTNYQCICPPMFIYIGLTLTFKLYLALYS